MINESLHPSEGCLALIRESEGFEPYPYLCPAGVPTIGYGSTRYEDGRPVQLNDPPITKDRADSIMLVTLVEYAATVRRYVQVPLAQCQFDALVDFAYNVGAKALLQSTLLRLLNIGDYVGASKQFERWVYGAGMKLPGLVKRREMERLLFIGGCQTIVNNHG